MIIHVSRTCAQQSTFPDTDVYTIVQGGGTYGDKNAAIERLKAEYKKLPESVQAR